MRVRQRRAALVPAFLGLILLAGGLPADAQTAQPAFDCSGDVNATEAAICNTDALARADVQLNHLYRQTLAALADATSRERIKTQQKQFLKARNACKTDADCIGAAYRARMDQLSPGQAQAAPAPRPEEIRFQFDTPVDGYVVSGLWFPTVLPDDLDPMGPAIIRLSNPQSGQVVQFSENAVALLDQAGRDALTTASGQIDLARAKGVLHLAYGDPDRATQASCPDSGDTCLSLGEIPVDLQDLDFDGRPEVVIAHKRMGQRGSTAYSVYAINEGEAGAPLAADNLGQGVWGYPVFARIDSMSTFNRDKRVITVSNSGGACASSLETYAADTEVPFSLTRYQVDLIDAKEDCVTQVYRVETQDNGVVTYTPVP